MFIGGPLALLCLFYLFVESNGGSNPTSGSNNTTNVYVEDVTESEEKMAEDVPPSLAPPPLTSSALLDDFQLHFGLKDEFDTFILDYDGEDANKVVNQYRQHASKSFSAPSSEYATALFARYVEYKIALSSEDVDVDLNVHELSDVSYKLDFRDDLRHKYFSAEEYHYLFSEGAAIDRAALKRLQISKDTTLSREERTSLIMESLKNASDTERQAFKPTVSMHEIKKIKEKHPDLTSRYNAVAAQFGNDVADRFMETWQSQANWESRVNAYQKFKQQVIESTDDKGERLDAVRRYEEENFTVNELKRLRVLTQ